MPDTQESINNEGLPVVTLSVSESEPSSITFGVSPSNTVQAPVDATLRLAGKAADAKATGDAIRSIKPTTNGNAGQLLRTNGDGTTMWADQGLPSDAQTATAVNAWLNDHPEATTTVEDGAITRVKLNADLQRKTDDVDNIMTAFINDTEQITGNTPYVFTKGYYRVFDDLTVVDITEPERSNTTSQTMVTTLIRCQPGEKYTIRAYGAATAAAAYGYLDANQRGIYREGKNSLVDETITVPDKKTIGGVDYVPAWLIVNNNLTNNASDYYAYKGDALVSRVAALETGVNTLVSSVEGIEASKQDALTFDDAPTVDSDNPVKSGGVANAERVSANSVDGAMSELFGKTVYTPDIFGYYYTAAVNQTYANMAERLTKSAGYSCMLIEVTPGEAYHIHTHGIGGTNRGWIKCAADGTRTDYSRTTSGVEDRVILIEQGEKYLAINNRTESGTECWAIKLKNDERFDFVGKNVAIIGDSINTNGDYIKNGVVNPLGNVPEIVIMQEDVGATLSAYVTAYDVGTELHGEVTIDDVTTTGHTIVAEDAGKEITFIPVQADVTEPPTIIGKPLTYNQESRKVWWEHAMDVYGFNPIPVCWSGSSMSSHEGGTSYAWHESTIRKCGIRTPGSMTRTAPDLIIVSRGANDFTHTPYAKVEEDYLFSTMHGYPDTDEYIEDGTTKYSFPRACALLVKRLRTAYPNTQIVFCTINYLQRIVESYPTRTGSTGSTYLMWNQCIRNVANAFGCHLIEFDKDGLVFENIADYTVDTNDTHVHPNDAGHKIMGNRAIIDLKKINSMA